MGKAIFHHRLQQELEHIAFLHLGGNPDLRLKPPGEPDVLDLQVIAGKVDLICHWDHAVLHHVVAQQLGEVVRDLHDLGHVLNLGQGADGVQGVV